LGILVEFASIVDAVHCAIEIQKTIANANDVQPEAVQTRFRVGINVGDVMRRSASAGAPT
jgi:adenylate cyclase